MKKEKALIIGGGVGPMAGVLFHQYLIEATHTQGADQDHFPIYHLSHASKIPDRTQFLLGKSSENPGLILSDIIKPFTTLLREKHQEVLIAVPCNTFHAPVIFNSFVQALKTKGIKSLNLIQETVDHLKSQGIIRAGLLSTLGTRQLGFYQDQLAEKSIETILLDEQDHVHLHEAIYDSKEGIKALSRASNKVKGYCHNMAQKLIEKGAQIIILGCTELPLAFDETSINHIPLLDPMRVLAHQAAQQMQQAIIQ